MKNDPVFDAAMQRQANSAYQFALLMSGKPNTYKFDSAPWPVIAGLDRREAGE